MLTLCSKIDPEGAVFNMIPLAPPWALGPGPGWGGGGVGGGAVLIHQEGSAEQIIWGPSIWHEHWLCHLPGGDLEQVLSIL